MVIKMLYFTNSFSLNWILDVDSYSLNVHEIDNKEIEARKENEEYLVGNPKEKLSYNDKLIIGNKLIYPTYRVINVEDIEEEVARLNEEREEENCRYIVMDNNNAAYIITIKGYIASYKRI